MRVLFCLAWTTFTFGICAAESRAQDCRKYLGKGYCTDYVKMRLGRKPTGNAGSWAPNISPRDVRPGDAAIFTSPAPFGHVAIVERVIYERNTATPYQVEISEWNWGSTYIDKACAVTSMFGKVTRRIVRVNTIKGYWRP